MRFSQVLTTRPGEPPGAKHRPSRGDACGLWVQFRELGFSEDDAERFPEMSPKPQGAFGAKEGNLWLATWEVRHVKGALAVAGVLLGACFVLRDGPGAARRGLWGDVGAQFGHLVGFQGPCSHTGTPTCCCLSGLGH